MRYFASNTIQYPANKNIRNDACSFSVSVNSDLPFMSANLTNKKEIINPMIAQVMIIKMLKLMQLIIKINNIKVKNK
jgi:hypothetical protein